MVLTGTNVPAGTGLVARPERDPDIRGRADESMITLAAAPDHELRAAAGTHRDVREEVWPE